MRRSVSLLSSFAPSVEHLERRRLLAASVAGEQLVIHGTEADDVILVSYDAGDDALVVSVNGEETRHAAAGLTSLSILALAGNDTVELDAGVALDARIYGGEGNDLLQGGVGHDRLFGAQGDDTLVGQGGDDHLRGGEGDDQLNGGAGNDRMWGHAGADVMLGGEGDDLLRGGAAADIMKGEEGDDTLLGHEGDDDMLGGDGEDLIRGHGGRDRAWGGRGRDALDGGEDDDDLDGGADRNTLVGGSGVNTFVGDRRANVFADFATRKDWVAALLADARDGGVKRYRDETGAGLFTDDHPALEALMAAFAHDGRNVADLADARRQSHGNGGGRR